MDPAVAWYQPEQEGPAKRLWLRIWETQSEIDKMNLKNLENSNPNINKAQDFIPIHDVNGEVRNNNYFNPARRKINDNRASTFNLNKNHDALIGEYGGCPWRIPNYHYKPGILGWVAFLITVGYDEWSVNVLVRSWGADTECRACARWRRPAERVSPPCAR